MGNEAPERTGRFDRYRSWKGWDAAAFGECSHSEGMAYHAELSDVVRSPGPGLRVLELGFGNGNFARWAGDRGWSYVGTEVDRELVARALKSGLVALEAGAARGRLVEFGPFDMVVAWDVLEHLCPSALAETLRECRSVLSRGGAMVARLPAAESPFSRGIQHGDDTHRQAMTSHGMRRAFLAAGFAACITRGTRLPIWGMPPAAFLRRILVRGTDAAVHPIVRILMRDRHAVLTPNMIVVAKT